MTTSGVAELGEEIVLFLAVVSILLPTIQKRYRYGPLLETTPVIFRLETELFLDLTMQCVQQCFALLHASLRELPTARDIAALAEQNLAPAISQNNCGIRAV